MALCFTSLAKPEDLSLRILFTTNSMYWLIGIQSVFQSSMKYTDLHLMIIYTSKKFYLSNCIIYITVAVLRVHKPCKSQFGLESKTYLGH